MTRYLTNLGLGIALLIVGAAAVIIIRLMGI
jgi:hypothetical protein